VARSRFPGVLLARDVAVVVGKDAPRRGQGVVKLPGVHGPEKRAKETECDQQAGEKKDEEHAHEATPLRTAADVEIPQRRAAARVARTANATTVTELSGIRIAETSGESRPLTANESPTAL
jgi:hypothetical protein